MRSAREPSHPTERYLLNAYFRQVPLNLAFNTAAALVVTAILAPSAPAGWLWVWAIGLLGPTAYMATRQLIRHIKPPKTKSGTAEKMRNKAVFWAAYIGMAWGASSLFLWYLNAEESMTLIIVVAVMAAISTTTMSAIPRAAVVFSVTSVLPFFFALVLDGSLPRFWLAIMAAILIAALEASNRIVYRAHRSASDALENAKVAHADLEQAQAEWMEISDTAEAFALFDDQAKLLLWNHAYERLLGFPTNILERGDKWEDILAETTARLPVERRWQTSAAPQTMEWAQGGQWYRSTIRRLRSGHVGITHVNITNLKQREQHLLATKKDLKLARDEAESANAAKNSFLAHMSHELRTPLNAVIGYAELLHLKMEELPGDVTWPREQWQDYSKNISQSGEHLLTIVNEILDHARAQSGKATLEEATVDLEGVAQEVSTMMSGPAAKRKIELSFQSFGEPGAYRADRRLICQALLNLASNAVKFSPEGSRVDIVLRFSASGDADLIVRDRGIGIAPENLKRVFEPFSQADDSVSKHFGGTGLGLSLSKRWVELHGGTLTLSSQKG
ncbi:MAG: ATP-binding protein, partial [Pseudomonadota bacterium]